jgi:hypothetical protein
MNHGHGRLAHRQATPLASSDYGWNPPADTAGSFCLLPVSLTGDTMTVEILQQRELDTPCLNFWAFLELHSLFGML